MMIKTAMESVVPWEPEVGNLTQSRWEAKGGLQGEMVPELGSEG